MLVLQNRKCVMIVCIFGLFLYVGVILDDFQYFFLECTFNASVYLTVVIALFHVSFIGVRDILTRPT